MAQQIYEILPGRPFGRGTADSTISADPCARARVTAGTSGAFTITVDNKSGTFADDDLILIHQTRSTVNPGAWEVNRISSGAAGGTFTLASALSNNYSSTTGISNSNQCQVVQIKEYLNLTMNSQFSITPWLSDESYQTYCRGGLMAVAVKRQFTLNTTISAAGRNGWSTGQDHNGQSFNTFMQDHIGGGFRGGTNTTDSNHSGVGEGYTGNYLVEDGNAYGNGGRGSNGGGAGGGYNGSPTSLSTLLFGGAGGGGYGNNGNDTSSSGGNGAGAIVIWARYADLSTGVITANGGSSSGSVWGSQGYGGGGAGGSVMLNCQRAVLGTHNSITVNAGSGGGNSAGGNPGVIRINYGNTYTGSITSNTTYNQNTRLKIASGMMQTI